MAVVYESRSQVPEEYTWNLGDIFPTEDDWKAEYEALKNAGGEITARRGRGKGSPLPIRPQTGR